MKIVQIAALIVFAIGIFLLFQYDTSVGRNLRTPSWDRIMPKNKDSTVRNSFKELLDLYADTVGYPDACTSLYVKLRPGWENPGEPLPKEVQNLWAPIFERGGVTMTALEMDYLANNNPNLDSDNNLVSNNSSNLGSLFPQATNASTTPGLAHFYCLCPKRTELCQTDFCDTILTYNDTGNEYNLPDSTWTTARNAMYYLAKQRRHAAQMQGKTPESHYCFFDGDLWIEGTTKQALQEQLAAEPERNKIIAFNYRGQFARAQYAFKIDANFNCFAESSMDQYLPYSSLKDDQAWYLSQTDLIIRSNLVEPFAFKIYPHVRTQNPAHNNDYPRNGGPGGVQLLQRQALEGYSSGCHPPTNHPKRIQVHDCTFQGRHLFTFTFNATHRLG